MEQLLNLMDFTYEELDAWLQGQGMPKFRTKQVFSWVQKGVASVDEMTNLSKELRQKIAEQAHTGYLKVREKLVSKLDGTIKYLMQLQDGNIVECVLMEYKHGTTICVSTQVGCKMGCTFCASAVLGFRRNLSAGEMLGEIITAAKDSGRTISNVVLMGIGEPLDNYDNVIKFLKMANDPRGLNIGGRHFSLSTSGIVPRIYDLMEENLQLTLAISLHSTNDADRSRIMPINKTYSIDKLLEACKIYINKTRRRITFEYAMIAGVNDTAQHANELGKLLKGMLCHVNLIPVNTVKGTGYKKSNKREIEAFVEVLGKYGVEATVRRELGSDIEAACGQLRRSVIEQEAQSAGG